MKIYNSLGRGEKECGFLSQWKKNPQEPDVIHLSHNNNINPLSNNTQGTHRRHFVFQTVTSG